jgi:hypothetical protein
MPDDPRRVIEEKYPDYTYRKYDFRPAAELVGCGYPDYLIEIEAFLEDPSLDASSLPGGDVTSFRHPGLVHTGEGLAAVRDRVRRGEEPWSGSFSALERWGDRHAGRRPSPHRYVHQTTPVHLGVDDLNADAHAAYPLAYLWALSERREFGRTAVGIMNGWANVLEGIGGEGFNLVGGMTLNSLLNCAEIMRCTSDLWAEPDRARFETMIREVFLPLVANFRVYYNGNHDHAACLGLMTAAIYLDEPDLFRRAVAYYLGSKTAGSIGNYVTEWGECQESGRDYDHVAFGLGVFSQSALLAHRQGVDLYGAFDDLLMKGIEGYSRVQLDYFQPARYCAAWPFPTIHGRHLNRMIFAFEHYAGERGLDMPFTRELLASFPEETNEFQVYHQRPILELGSPSPAPAAPAAAARGSGGVVISSDGRYRRALARVRDGEVDAAIVDPMVYVR